MQNFNNTFKLLNALINKLQANTGGELNVPAEKAEQMKPIIQKPQEIVIQEPLNEGTKKQEKPKKKIEEFPADNIGEKKQKPEKKEKKQKKQKKKGDVEVKKEEKKEKPSEKKQPGEIGVEDFALIDMRIGQIVEAWKHPQSEKLYCQKINVCGEIREIASGLQQFVAMENMKGPVVVMVNLKPRPLGGFPSNGMVVCASNGDHTDVEIIRPQGANSERIYLEGYEQLFRCEGIMPVLNPKKKVLDKCAEFFRTDAEGFVTWKGIRARTSGGYLRVKITEGTVS